MAISPVLKLFVLFANSWAEARFMRELYLFVATKISFLSIEL